MVRKLKTSFKGEYDITTMTIRIDPLKWESIPVKLQKLLI